MTVALTRTMTNKKSEKQLGSKGMRSKLVTHASRKAAEKPPAVRMKRSARSTSARDLDVDAPALSSTLNTLKNRSIKTVAASAAKMRVKAPVAKARKAPTKALKKSRVRQDVASEIAHAMMGEMSADGEDSVLERQALKSQRERDLLSRLAVSMSRMDEMPNMELAADIVVADDFDAVGMLIGVLERHDDVHAMDAARVLYEVGTRAPELLDRHAERLLAMCESSQKEMLPYTMFALAPVASHYLDTLWDLRDLFWVALADLTQPANMAQAGAVRLLSALCAAGPDYARTLAGGLVDLLGKCMPKDVAFFAESVLPALGTAHSHRAKPVLDRRMKELTPAEVARLRRAVRAAQTGQPLFAAA